MNRYDLHFRSLPAHAQRSATHRVGFAQQAIYQHRLNGFEPDDDGAVVRQFDLSGISDFWEVVLSEPMAGVKFARALALHFYEVHPLSKTKKALNRQRQQAASKVVDDYEAGTRQALRDAYKNGEPWFIEVPPDRSNGKLAHPYRWVKVPGKDDPVSALFVPPDPPSDGIDLSTLRVRPRDAVAWMLASPMRQNLVPPSLVSALRQPETSAITFTGLAPSILASGAPGRPSSMHLVKAEMARRAEVGESASTMRAEAAVLIAWLTKTHPDTPPLGVKAVANKLGGQFRASRKYSQNENIGMTFSGSK